MDMKRLKNSMWTLLTESPEKPTEVSDSDSHHSSASGLETPVLCHCLYLFVEQACSLGFSCWSVWYIFIVSAKISCSLQVVETPEKPEVCGEKAFSQTTKTLLQRYKQTSHHACNTTAVTRNNNDWIALAKVELHANMCTCYILHFSAISGLLYTFLSSLFLWLRIIFNRQSYHAATTTILSLQNFESHRELQVWWEKFLSVSL